MSSFDFSYILNGLVSLLIFSLQSYSVLLLVFYSHVSVWHLKEGLRMAKAEIILDSFWMHLMSFKYISGETYFRFSNISN